LLSYVERLQSSNADDRRYLFLRMLEALPQGAAALAQLDTLAGRNAAARRAVERTKSQLIERVRPQIAAAVAPVYEQTQYEEFDRAIRAGRLILDPLTPERQRSSRKT